MDNLTLLTADRELPALPSRNREAVGGELHEDDFAHNPRMLTKERVGIQSGFLSRLFEPRLLSLFFSLLQPPPQFVGEIQQEQQQQEKIVPKKEVLQKFGDVPV